MVLHRAIKAARSNHCFTQTKPRLASLSGDSAREGPIPPGGNPDVRQSHGNAA